MILYYNHTKEISDFSLGYQSTVIGLLKPCFKKNLLCLRVYYLAERLSNNTKRFSEAL